jgi:hypothetical protein
MNWICTGAAVIIAASAALLAGCASEQKVSEADLADKNPCLGVDPPTGSLVRRNSDCGYRPKQDDQDKQAIIDSIRARSGLSGSPMMNGNASFGQ